MYVLLLPDCMDQSKYTITTAISCTAHINNISSSIMSENIQVIVRCRARSKREVAANSPPVIELPNDVFSAQEPYVGVSTDQPSLLSAKSSFPGGKVFKVDQVYGPNADQQLLFENVALPLFDDFVKGLNVTILAYGQTGSGKTYSMCGDLEGEHAGIIPRVLSRLFSVLNGDYMVKLSCVELYKEELRDLVNDELDLAPIKSKLRLVSDTSGPGPASSTIIHNLSQIHIDSSEMGFNILKKCLTKRRTGSTRVNDLSSRSHAIFTINLYREVKNAAGSSEYRISKMNLVDLAGSEDINKSGAINERAREAGSINQSLLTLGKVINSLSEGKEQKHIPYRESKLTRLLQGSIGGKTKTALIATISPAKINVHETISTLNYASKAKNIRNLPQSSFDSEMILKKVLVSDLSGQISRMTRDLMANKDKENGIRMSVLNYEELNKSVTSLQTDLQEKASEITGLKLKLDAKNSEIEMLHEKVNEMEKSSQSIKSTLESKDKELKLLSLDLTSLQKRYTMQNEQVSRVVQSNVKEVSNALNQIIKTFRTDNNVISLDLESLSSELNVQVARLLEHLTQNADRIEKLLESQSASIAKTLQGCIDFSPMVAEVEKFKVEYKLQELSSFNNSSFESLKSQFEPNSHLHQKVMEQARIELDKNSQVFKQEMLGEITATVELLFKSKITQLQNPIESATRSILDAGHELIGEKKDATNSKIELVSNQLKTETQQLKQEIASLHGRFNNQLTSATAEISTNLKSGFNDAIEEVTRSIVAGANSSVEKTDLRISHVKAAVEKMGASASKKLELATKNLNEFEDAITTLENSAGGRSNSVLQNASPSKETSILQPPVVSLLPSLRSPSKTLARSPSSNSCATSKRRKPGSPLKENNGSFRSKIPHFSLK